MNIIRIVCLCCFIALCPIQTFAMQIFVKLNPKVVTLEVEPSDSIADVKSKVQDLQGISPDLQLLRFKGSILDNDKTLADYSVYKESVLSLEPDLQVHAFTGDLTWVGGTTYWLPLYDAVGSAGSDWRLLEVSGTMTIDATADNPVILRPITYSSQTRYVPGEMINFDKNGSYKWTFLTAAAINGFAKDRFVIDLSDFANDRGDGVFSLREGSLSLQFSAVPEPSSAVLIAFSLLLFRFKRFMSQWFSLSGMKKVQF